MQNNSPVGVSSVSRSIDIDIPEGLLHREALLDAAHACYASVWADEFEERGGRFRPGCDIADQVERLPDSVQLQIIWRYLGRIEQAWRHDVGLVFHHMGLKDVETQATALFLLLMGCMGHGIGLRDDFDAAFDRACNLLGMTGADESPSLFEPMEWREIAEQVLGDSR